MAVSKKNRRVWAYLDEDDEARLLRVLAITRPHLDEAPVLSVILKAGLKAMEANGYRNVLPVLFKVESSECSPPMRVVTLNDQPPKRK